MASNAYLVFKTQKFRGDLERRCGEVLKHFNLPDRRLLCGFDDERSAWFKNISCEDARGVHCLAQGSGLWPNFLETYRYEDAAPAFDSLIYIPAIPPTDVPFVFVVTFAHELQHFVQCWIEPKVWLANNFLYTNLPHLDSDIPPSETWRVLTERDAIIRSKQVAVVLFGRDGIQKEVRALIAKNTAPQEWKYFEALPPSVSCDLRDETDQLVKQYRKEIIRYRNDWPDEIDFGKDDWWQ